MALETRLSRTYRHWASGLALEITVFTLFVAALCALGWAIAVLV